MKTFTNFFAILVVVSCLALACKKSSTTPTDNVINTTVTDNGKTIAVASGQTVAVTLNNPIDGGYEFNTPIYDAGVLNLSSHTHTPGDINRTGDGGTDTFNFTSLKSGTTNLSITASRGKTDTISMFTAKVVVQ